MRLTQSISSFLRRKRLAKFVILVIGLFALYQTLTTTNTERMPMEFKFLSDHPADPLERSSLNVLNDRDQARTSGLNAHVWYDVCASSVKSLCNYPLFPQAPNKRTLITTTDLSRVQDNYAQRIFGILHPPRTGKYRFAISSDDFSELWLSPSEDPSKAVLICSVKEWSGRDEFQRWPSQISKQVDLQENRKYYIEIIHVQFGGDEFIKVVWSVPGRRAVFKAIHSDSTSLFFNDTGSPLHNYFTAPPSAACDSRSHHQHNSEPEVKGMPVYLPHEALADVLPYCDYKPSYLQKNKIPDVPQNVYAFLNSHYFPVDSFPPIEYKEVVNPFSAFGNHELDIMAAQKAAKLYMDSLHQHYPG